MNITDTGSIVGALSVYVVGTLSAVVGVYVGVIVGTLSACMSVRLSVHLSVVVGTVVGSCSAFFVGEIVTEFVHLSRLSVTST
jgi:hypothetical protein